MSHEEYTVVLINMKICWNLFIVSVHRDNTQKNPIKQRAALFKPGGAANRDILSIFRLRFSLSSCEKKGKHRNRHSCKTIKAWPHRARRVNASRPRHMRDALLHLINSIVVTTPSAMRWYITSRTRRGLFWEMQKRIATRTRFWCGQAIMVGPAKLQI